MVLGPSLSCLDQDLSTADSSAQQGGAGSVARAALAVVQGTYRNQSTAMMSVISSVGSPTDVSTIIMVTRPAWGMPAAPMLAAVAVMLERTGKHSYQQQKEKGSSAFN